MAAINQEIKRRLEDEAGSRIKSVSQDPKRIGYLVEFWNSKMAFIDYLAVSTNYSGGSLYHFEDSVCVSCGESHIETKFDFAERCENKLKKIWENARKVYWHRYLKNRK